MKADVLDWDRATVVLREAGLRATPARKAILKAMYGKGPLTEEEIAARVGHHSADQATLYRNLSTLQRVGLVRRHSFSSRVLYFSLHLPGEEACEHAHFLCESCGRCECLEDAKLTEKPFELGGRVVKSVEVVVNGICNGCRRSRKGGKR